MEVNILNPLSDLEVQVNANNQSFDLSTNFDDPFTTGQIATFQLADTTLGNNGIIEVVLFDQSGTGAPNSVANFRNYVEDGDYDNTIIHRSIPNFIIQGGGFIVDENLEVSDVPSDAPVDNEFSAERSNVRGTIAFAKVGGDPDSATSQWFFNLADNSENLDNQNGGFTVFGEVVGAEDLATIDAIADIPVYDATAFFNEPAFTDVPADIDPNDPVLDSREELVLFDEISIFEVEELTFAVTDNSNPDLVSASVNSDGELLLDYQPNQTGTAEITVEATNLLGQSETDTFSVTVNPAPDTTPPEVEIIGVPETITTLDPFEVSFEFSEPVTGFEAGEVSVENGSLSAFPSTDGTSFTSTLTPDGNGDIFIDVPAGVAVDAADNANTAAPTAEVDVELNTTPPEENTAPTLDPISVEGLEDQTVNFTGEVFTAAFSDEDGDDLESVRVITLPGAGDISLNGQPVTEGQDILAEDLGNLGYSPAENAVGEVTFIVTASDGTDSSEETTVTIDLGGVNDAPTFTLIDNPNQVALPGESVTVPDFVTNISPGAEDDPNQTVELNVEIQGRDIFAVDPTIDVDTGTLSYTLAEDVVGASPIRVTAVDSGGTGNGGVNTSEPTTFVIRTDVSSLVRAETNANENSRVNRLVYDTTDQVLEGTNFRPSLPEDVQDLGTDAVFNNIVGLYEVDDENGGIDTDDNGVVDLQPGDPGYAEAALTRQRVNGFEILAGASGDPALNTDAGIFEDVLLNGGALYAPFVIANGAGVGFDGFIEQEEGEADGDFNDAADFINDLVAYFAFGEANPDNVEHLFNYGNGIFGFEDLPGNLGVSDNDFNDAIFQFNFIA